MVEIRKLNEVLTAARCRIFSEGEPYCTRTHRVPTSPCAGIATWHNDFAANRMINVG